MNKMYEYLEEHAYISKNKKSNYQFELSKARAECIANKYNSLCEEKDKEIERLNKKLEVAKTNEETYRLEMLDITKRLGLDEETLFDDVKDKAERLNNIINELEEDLYKIRELTFKKYNSNEWNNCLSFNDDILPVINRLKELKESDKE